MPYVVWMMFIQIIFETMLEELRSDAVVPDSALKQLEQMPTM
jgi:hypothetical protein